MAVPPDALGSTSPQVRPAMPAGIVATTAELLEPGLARRPDALALVGAGGRLSFRELDEQVGRAVAVLRALGVREGRGDRVAVCLPNDVDVAIHFLASQRLGAIHVGLQRPLAPAEKVALLRDCEPTMLLADRATLDTLSDGPLPDGLAAVDLDAWRDRLAGSAPERPARAPDPFAPAAIGYTSGTTGVPKGVVHSQHNLMLAGAMLSVAGPRSGGPVGVVLSLTLLNMIARAMVAAWSDEQTLVCLDRHDPDAIASAVADERIRSLDLVPALAHDLLARADLGARLATLEDVAIGGASCPPEIVDGFRRALGLEVSLAYGLTEAPTGVAIGRGEQVAGLGAFARAVPQVELRVVEPESDDAAPLPAGELGELCVGPATRGPYAGLYTPMLGYWRRPEETARALRGGLLHTGDLGSIDEQGRVFVRGRGSERILRGGANVHPLEIERVLERHESVRGAAVFGVPDERLGERVAAAVELAPEALPVDGAALRAWVGTRLARYKVPERILVLPALPRTALGKVRKRELAASYGAAMGEGGESR